MRLLVRDATLLTLDAGDRVIPRGHLAVEDDRIALVADGDPPPGLAADRVIDGRDRLVLPGLVNCHLHSHENFNRGRLDNLPHNVWMIYARPPLVAGAAPRPTDVYLRTMLGGLEMLRSGVTLAVDDVVHAPATDLAAFEAVVQAYRDVGLRAVVTATTVDRPYHQTLPWAEEVFPAALQQEFLAQPRPTIPELTGFARRCRDLCGDGPVRFALSPSAPQRCSRELLEALRDLRRELAVPLVVHTLETRLQVVAGQAFYGRSPIAYLDDLGLLAPETALVHCVWVDAADIARIAAGGATVFHNPSSNLKLGSGVAPVRALRRAGVPVGLGTDGMGSNDCQNLFEEMRLAALVAKITAPAYEEWLTAGEILRLATGGGLSALGLSGRLGALEPGRLADFVLLDLAGIPFTPRHDLVRQVVYAERGGSVRTVVVGGRVVLDEGRIATVDEPKLLREIAGAAERVAAAREAGWHRSRELEPYFAEIYRRAAREPVAVAPRVLW